MKNHHRILGVLCLSFAGIVLGANRAAAECGSCFAYHHELTVAASVEPTTNGVQCAVSNPWTACAAAASCGTNCGCPACCKIGPSWMMGCSDADSDSGSPSSSAGASCEDVSIDPSVGLGCYYWAAVAFNGCDISQTVSGTFLAEDDVHKACLRPVYGGGGATAADADYDITLNGEPTNEYQLVWQIYSETTLEECGGRGEPEGQDSVLTHTGALVYLEGNPIDVSQILSDGVTFVTDDYQWDAGTESWLREGSVSTGLPVGGGAVKVLSFHFNDREYDVNADGRFNRYDPPALQALIGSTDPELMKYDINGNAEIDQADVDFLQALVDSGIDAGVLGDYDQNGGLNCTDFELMYPMGDFTFPLSELGDPEYRIELDANLDGDIDMADLWEIALAFGWEGGLIPEICQTACCVDYECTMMFRGDCGTLGGWWMGPGSSCNPSPCICRGDSNCDGVRDFADIDYLVAAIGDDVAAWEAMFAPDTPSCPFENNDVNLDGTVDFDDIDPFIALIGTPCP